MVRKNEIRIIQSYITLLCIVTHSLPIQNIQISKSRTSHEPLYISLYAHLCRTCINNHSLVSIFILERDENLYMELVVNIDHAPIHIVTVVITLRRTGSWENVFLSAFLNFDLHVDLCRYMPQRVCYYHRAGRL